MHLPSLAHLSHSPVQRNEKFYESSFSLSFQAQKEPDGILLDRVQELNMIIILLDNSCASYEHWSSASWFALVSFRHRCQF